jgi:hypothetical protein
LLDDGEDLVEDVGVGGLPSRQRGSGGGHVGESGCNTAWTINAH